jgi:hypothetical protein
MRRCWRRLEGVFFDSQPQQTPTDCIAKAQNPVAREGAGRVLELVARKNPVRRKAPFAPKIASWRRHAQTDSTLDPILRPRDETRTSRILLFGAIRVPVPKPPTDEPNRCNLRQQTPRRLRKPLYRFPPSDTPLGRETGQAGGWNWNCARRGQITSGNKIVRPSGRTFSRSHGDGRYQFKRLQPQGVKGQGQ